MTERLNYSVIAATLAMFGGASTLGCGSQSPAQSPVQAKEAPMAGAAGAHSTCAASGNCGAMKKGSSATSPADPSAQAQVNQEPATSGSAQASCGAKKAPDSAASAALPSQVAPASSAAPGEPPATAPKKRKPRAGAAGGCGAGTCGG